MEEAEKPCSKKEERRPLPYQQQTRMATTGRIAVEGNIVTSLEDAAFLPSPIRKSAQEPGTICSSISSDAPLRTSLLRTPLLRTRAKGLRILCVFADLFGCDPLRYRLGLSRFESKKGMAT